MTNKREVHFSVQGKFITNLAREKLYQNNDIIGAIKLLMSCLVSDEITPEQRFIAALKILDGKYSIVGTYPGDDYGIEETETCSDPQVIGVTEYFGKQAETIDSLKQELQDFKEKLSLILDLLQEQQLNEIKQELMAHDGNAAAAKYMAVKYIADEINDRISEPDITPMESSLVNSFLKQAHIEEKFDNNYGWLAPDGTFYPVEWGEHQTWAYEYIEEHYPTDKPACNTGKCGDILIERGWILMHNPAHGIANPTRNHTKRITKKQSEFLFDYYTERELHDRAKEFLQQD